MSERFEVKLGPSRLVLDSSLFTIKSTRKLDKELDIAFSDWTDSVNEKLKLIGELNEEYREVLTKKEEESDEEYRERTKPLQKEIEEKVEAIVGEDSLDSVNPLAYSALKTLAALDGQDSKVTKDNFDNSVRDDIDQFILNVTKKAKINRFNTLYSEFVKDK